MTKCRNRRRRLLHRWLLLVATGLPLIAGCVQRRMTIRSDPPGALVYVDNEPIGTTPVSHDFVYYGTRDIRLVKDGYETLSVLRPIPTPWYELPGIDFFSENVVPGETRDERGFFYRLVPQQIVPVEEFLARGENLRTAANTDPATSPVAPLTGSTVVPGLVPAAPPVVYPEPQPSRPWPTPRRPWPVP